MQIEILIHAFTVGLSTGLFCVSTCLPFVASYMTAAERTSRGHAGALLRFLGGRFTGYLTVGLVFGLAGEKIEARWFSLANDAALILLSLLLIAYLTGLLREKSPACPGSNGKWAGRPFLMGLGMGLNICPPFLMSLSYVLTLESVLFSLFYFTCFFAASSLYFLPFFFAGGLARFPEVRTAARLSGLLAGFLFILYAVFSIIRTAQGG
ncbi:MAG: sulfite exporter TauE/SafE family protein [Candidatus Omnitrophota bacterium]